MYFISKFILIFSLTLSLISCKVHYIQTGYPKNFLSSWKVKASVILLNSSDGIIENIDLSKYNKDNNPNIQATLIGPLFSKENCVLNVNILENSNGGIISLNKVISLNLNSSNLCQSFISHLSDELTATKEFNFELKICGFNGSCIRFD